jgi:hypothetical protein
MGSRFFLVQQRSFSNSTFQEDFVDAQVQMARAMLFSASGAGSPGGAGDGTNHRTK